MFIPLKAIPDQHKYFSAAFALKLKLIRLTMLYLLHFLHRDPWKALVDNAAVTSLCPQRHKHSPPTTRVPSTALPPLLPLPSASLSPAIIWLNSRERASSRIFFWGGEVISHSAISSMFFFPSKSWENKKKSFSEEFWPTSKLLHAHHSSAGAMSLPLSQSKDQPRIRKTTTDSSPTSLSARSLRVRLIDPARVHLVEGLWH